MLEGLYVFSNINIPLMVLVYLTILKMRKKQPIGYGKWFLMIVIMFLTNLITSFFQIRGFLLLIDFVIKIIICLLPSSANEFIETKISHLHLQILIEHVRCMIINHYAIWHWKLTQFSLSKMDQLQRKQFKNVLIQRLNDKQQTNKGTPQKNVHFQNQNRLADVLKSSYKHYENKGVSCDITPLATPIDSKIRDYALQTQKSIDKNKNTSKKQKDYVKQSPNYLQQQGQSIPNYNKYNLVNNYNTNSQNQQFQKQGYNRNSPYRSSSYQNIAKNSQQHHAVPQLNDSPNDYKHQHQYVGNYKLRKSATNILDQLDEQYPRNKFAQQIQQMAGSRQLRQKANFNKKPAILSNQHHTGHYRHRKQIEDRNMADTQKRQTNRNYAYRNSPIKQQQKKDDTAQRILQNLDVSASEYSQYFDQGDDFEDADKKLVCIVEAIVEIGHRVTAHLQIYNIQLYSNQEVRIVSLYGRQFQKGILNFLTQLPNNYYYLHFHRQNNQHEGNKRKVKFRGNAQPFMTYLRQNFVQ